MRMDVNPYAPPALETETPNRSIKWYATEIRGATYGELWCLTRNVGTFLLAAGIKTLRIKMPTTAAFAPDQPQIVPNEALPEDAREMMQPLAEEAFQLGLQLQFVYTVPCAGNQYSFAAASRSQDGRVYGAILYARSWNEPPVRKVFYCFTSRLADGRVLVTSSAPKELDSPPRIDVVRLLKRPMFEVYERHLERLRESSPAIPFLNATELAEFIRDYEHQTVEFFVARGLFVEVPPLEVERLAREMTMAGPPGPSVPPVPLQGVRTICWIALGVGAFFLNRPGNPAQLLFRFACVAVPALLLVAIHVFHFLSRSKST